jgi:hypothetical protein
MSGVRMPAFQSIPLGAFLVTYSSHTVNSMYWSGQLSASVANGSTLASQKEAQARIELSLKSLLRDHNIPLRKLFRFIKRSTRL